MNFDTPLALFQHLLAIDEDNMATKLSTLIDEKHEFYTEVTTLITAHEENKKQTSFNRLIGKQAEQLVEDHVIHELLGSQVGVYKLTKKLGQGGMGAVYLGERNDGQLEQKVAIKFVYPSIAALAGDDFLQKEAQHLANLDHVNIAKIFTVDKTENQLPYMVMEYVEGVPIDQYCDEKNLNLKERLKLFQKVCSAVQNAHQNMVIHADIKPSNILVDKQGEPKLMDFGIARDINLYDVSKESFLNAVSRDFASPEQLANKSLTTACDIYSIGKMLDSIIEKHCIEMSSLLAKAMNHKVEGRYQTSLDLSDDITAYLEMRPLKAHVGFGYEIKKYVQRNSMLSALFLLIFCMAIAFTNWQQQQNYKLNQQVKLKEATLSYINKIFSYADPNISSKGDLSAIDLLNSALSNLNNSELEDNNVKASIFSMIGGAFHGLSKYEDSKRAFEQAMFLYNQVLQTDSPEYIEAMNNLAGAQRSLGNIKQAKELYQQVFALRDKVSEDKRAIYLNNIARIMFEDEDYPNAVKTFKSALKLDEKTLGNNHTQIAIRHSNIASVYQKMEKFDLAIKHILIAIDIDTFNYGEQHPNIAVSYNKLGSIYRELNQMEEAIQFMEKALTVGEKTIGRQHHYFGIFQFNYAKSLIKANKRSDGILQLNQAIALFKLKLGEQHPTYVKALYYKNNLGLL